MSTLTYQYVYFASGPHTRQPRSSAGPGGFALIETLPGGTLTSGDTFVASPQPASQAVNGNTYPFSFMNVSGGKDGGVTSFKANQPPPAVTVASANIVVLVVYAPEGGGGLGGGSGVTIDSFNESTGSLFNDTFVAVTPDASGSLTKSGNMEGYVSTASAETIKALSPTSPGGVDFVQWLTLPGTVNPSASLTAGANVSFSSLAFYKTPPVVTPPPPTTCQQELASLIQLVNDNGRPRLTVAEYNAFAAELRKCVAEGQLNGTEVENLLKTYLSLLNEPTVPGPPKTTLS